MEANIVIELGQRSASNHKEGTLRILCNLVGPLTHHLFILHTTNMVSVNNYTFFISLVPKCCVCDL